VTRSIADSPPVLSPDTTGPTRRVVGRYRGTRPGPLVIFVAGLHGNEPAGVEALERLFRGLDSEAPLICFIDSFTRPAVYPRNHIT